ncbi:hypothetical protein Tco_0461992 [Tanacetum coccineum]
METSSSNSEVVALQQRKLDERELHQKCLAGFEKPKTHLGFIRSSFNFLNTRLFEIAFRIFLREEHQTFREKMYHNFNYLKWQLERDNFYGHDSKTCLVVLTTQFKEFFDSKEVNASDVPNKCLQKNFNDVGLMGNDANADIGLSYDSDTVSEVPHDMLKNVFAYEIQSHEQPESISDTYEVNENNSNIIFDTPNMDPDRNKEEHDYLKANALLTTSLSAIEKEKHFAKDMTTESEYCKKIKLLNDKISNLKSQACEEDKTFAKENEKYNELRKAGQTDQTLRMLLSKEEMLIRENMDLALRTKMIIKSPLSYHGFVYAETQFEEPPKVPLKRRNVNLKDHLEQVQLRNYDPKLWNSLSMKYFCYVKQAMLKFKKQTFSKLELNRDDLFRMSFEQSINERVKNRVSEEFEPLVKNANLQLEMKDDLKYVMSLEDEFDEKCLILDIQSEFFKTQFESAISESHSYVYENEMFE